MLGIYFSLFSFPIEEKTFLGLIFDWIAVILSVTTSAIYSILLLFQPVSLLLLLLP